MSTPESTPFRKPGPEDVTNWYRWFFKQKLGSNPFHPTDVQQFWGKDKNNVEIWKKAMTNESVIYVVGAVATTVPADKPSQISNVNAIVSGSQATAVYSDGNGKPIQKLPPVAPRDITIDKDDSRDLFITISTELATETKYPNLADNLSQLAQQIIDREDIKGAPPAFLEFEDAQGEKYVVDGNQLKSGFRNIGTIDQLDVPPNNVGMLPPGSGRAAYCDYDVILKRTHEDKRRTLKPGTNKLRFGVQGQFFSYTVDYNITV